MSKQNSTNHTPIKAVALLSGGLDSVLAAKLISELGIQVYGITFILPWKCYDKPKAFDNAHKIGIPIIGRQLKEDFLQIIKNPNHGYGTAINPCVDCKIFMLKKAEAYRKQINAHFLFTGEVLGQRPLSQTSARLQLIERRTGLINKIVRPLSAQILEPTEAEQNGWVDREKLLDISGRSRKKQIALAQHYQLTGYSQPAGGCHLTERSFAKRIIDFFDHGNFDYRQTEPLMYARHYRIDKDYKVMLGRDEDENNRLVRAADNDDLLLTVAEKDKVGPLCLLKGPTPPTDILLICGGLIKHYSKYKQDPTLKIQSWQKSNPLEPHCFLAYNIPQTVIDQIKI